MSPDGTRPIGSELRERRRNRLSPLARYGECFGIRGLEPSVRHDRGRGPGSLAFAADGADGLSNRRLV